MSTLFKKAVRLSLVIGIIIGLSSWAQAIGMPWSQAKLIAANDQHFTDVQKLSGTGDVKFYQINLNPHQTWRITLDIPIDAPVVFQPQLVVFQPSSSTIGPLLPFTQPPNTIGLVYAASGTKTVFNSLTQTKTIKILDIAPRLTVAGDYFLAVYNWGSSQDHYRLTVDHQPLNLNWTDVLTVTGDWWNDQLLAGFSASSLFMPLLLIVLFALTWIRLNHRWLKHQPSSSTRPKNAKSKP